MTTTETATFQTVQVHRVWIRATPEAIWDAITKPEWTERYGYSGRADFDLRPGGAYRSLATPQQKAHGLPDVVVDGEVIEADPPRRLVHTMRMLVDEEAMSAGFTRVTYEIEPGVGGATQVTVTHDVSTAPQIAAVVGGGAAGTGAGGGWPFILSDLKSLLETGEALGYQP